MYLIDLFWLSSDNVRGNIEESTQSVDGLAHGEQELWSVWQQTGPLGGVHENGIAFAILYMAKLKNWQLASGGERFVLCCPFCERNAEIFEFDMSNNERKPDGFAAARQIKVVQNRFRRHFQSSFGPSLHSKIENYTGSIFTFFVTVSVLY